MLGKTSDFEHADAALERHRDDVAAPDLAARGGDPGAIDADITGIGQRRCSAAGAHQPGVP